jgi:hypothetical protein
MKVAIFCGDYGARTDGTAVGPGVVAYNIAKALNKHSKINFIMHHSTPCNDQSKQKNVYLQNNYHFLEPYLDQFDLIHVISNRKTALKLLKYNPILGTNVVFSFFSPECLTDEARKENSAVISEEAEICKHEWRAMLVPNESLMEKYRTRINAKHWYVLPAGVDSKRFSPGKETRVFYTFVGGKLKEYSKGEILVKELVDRLPEKKWKVKSSFSWFGHEEDLKRTKIYICASRHETDGIATKEAMSCGCPVVLNYYEYDGKEHVPPYGSEVSKIVYKRTAKNFADAILELEKEDLEEYSRKSREYILSNFTLHHTARRLEKIYEEVIKNGT